MATTLPFGSDTQKTIPFGGQSTIAPQQPKSSLADSIWSSIAGYGKNVANTVQQSGAAVNSAFTQPGVSPIEQGINAAGAAAGGVVNTAASLIPGGTTALNTLGKGFNAAINTAGNIGDIMGGAINATSHLTGVSYNTQKADTQAAQFANSGAGQGITRAANVGQSLGNVANTILGAEGVSRGLQSTANATGDTLSKMQGINAVSDTLPKEPAPINTAKVNDLYSRAIKPSVSGKTTAGAIDRANTQVVDGLQAIADNKANLSFTNADGETLSGATPKSVDQLSQAIEQTKKNVFSQYDALAKQAGESGVVVDGPKVARELQPVIDSKSLAIANPKAVEYAKAVQARFNEVGGIDAQTAQDVIQHYNDSLKAFYRNPSYDTASQASVDALIANKLREQLDTGISNLTGEQYGALKRQYGALSSMEKDVARRAQVWARQNNVGFAGNLANIASGAELVRALVTLNPADLAVSLGIKGIQKYINHLNNPDVGVAKIFAELNKSGRPSTPSMSEPVAPGTVENSSPNPTTQVPKVQGAR